MQCVPNRKDANVNGTDFVHTKHMHVHQWWHSCYGCRMHVKWCCQMWHMSGWEEVSEWQLCGLSRE